MKNIEITSLIVHLIEYSQNGTAHGNIGGLLDWISLGQEDGTALGSSVIVVDGELNML